MPSADICQQILALSAEQLAQAIKHREYSCSDVTETYLDRIEAYNPSLSAFVAVGRKRGMREAADKDQQLRKQARGASLPAFFGVPTGIKDLNLARGFPTRFGSNGHPIQHFFIDDQLAARVRLAGFINLGKLATAEFGAMPITEPDIHPPTVNPWNYAHSAGGSSGGSGSAVAAGLVPIATGSDGAGSIRIPCSFNHLVGIKPSRGRVANAYGFDDRTVLYTDGPIARSVRDAASLLDVLAGITAGKPHWAPKPIGNYRSAADSAGPTKLRIRVVYEHGLGPTHSEVQAATARAAEALRKLGHEVHEGHWTTHALQEFLPLWKYAIADAPLVLADRIQPITRWLYSEGKKLRKSDIDARTAALCSSLYTWFGDVDVVLSPTVSQPAPKLGLARDPHATPQALFERAAAIGAFTAVFNITGQPAISLPAGCTQSGLPIGIQLAGKLYDEHTLITLAAQLESALAIAPNAPPLRTAALPQASNGAL